MGLALVATGRACTGPPPLHLELVPLRPPAPAEGVTTVALQLRPVSLEPGEGFRDLPGEPVPGTVDRLVRVDGSVPQGAPFSFSALGAIPDMLLQWGGFDPLKPWSPTRVRGYRLELHQVGPPLPPPEGWEGPWDPGAQRWYAEPGPLLEDDEVVRWIHRNMAGRFGEETEPWLALQADAQGRPARLHLWLVLDGGFEDPKGLSLRLQPDLPGVVRARWDWGDGSVDESRSAAPGTPLPERLQARHVYREPPPEGGFQVRTELVLDWRFGSWSRDSAPWVWRASVRYLGYLDLAPLAEDWTEAEAAAIREEVEALRSRLRCLPGDQQAKVFSLGEPCTFLPAVRPDEFLQPGGMAIPELLRHLLPPRFAGRIGEIQRRGRGVSHELRYVFSGAFPQASAPLGASPEVTRLRGRPGRLSVP